MQSFIRSAVLMPVLLLLLAGTARATDSTKPVAKPSEQKLQAVLIWGTDEEKPEKPQHELKAVDDELHKKFQKIFKWKNYFQVGERQTFAIQSGETKQVKLSHKCELKVRQTDKEGLTVELIGEGKPVVKSSSMPLKDVLILAGDDKNATAWFVVLKPE